MLFVDNGDDGNHDHHGMMMMRKMRVVTLGWAETFEEFRSDISRKVELGWDLIYFFSPKNDNYYYCFHLSLNANI